MSDRHTRSELIAPVADSQVDKPVEPPCPSALVGKSVGGYRLKEHDACGSMTCTRLAPKAANGQTICDPRQTVTLLRAPPFPLSNEGCHCSGQTGGRLGELWARGWQDEVQLFTRGPGERYVGPGETQATSSLSS